MMGKSFVRFSPFARGRTVGKAEEGASRKKTQREVKKKDGKRACIKSIDAVLARNRADKSWQGKDSSAGGRPQSLTDSEVEQLKTLMHEEVGLAKVTIPYCKKRLPFLRRLSKECCRQSLLRLGYAWRLRRGKAATGTKYKPERLDFCAWVLKQKSSDLARWAYVDGTTFYLARTLGTV